jgi:hypothetical protein
LTWSLFKDTICIGSRKARLTNGDCELARVGDAQNISIAPELLGRRYYFASRPPSHAVLSAAMFHHCAANVEFLRCIVKREVHYFDEINQLDSLRND